MPKYKAELLLPSPRRRGELYLIPAQQHTRMCAHGAAGISPAGQGGASVAGGDTFRGKHLVWS